MRILKLVIWDLDETLITGVLEEENADMDPLARTVTKQLNDRGILQALATQNPPKVIPSAIQQLGWSDLFVQVEADLGPKARKVKHIFETLSIDPLDTAFVDNDPFERASISAQTPGITAWSVADLAGYLAATDSSAMTEEARRRPQMYREQQARERSEETAGDYTDFLRSCNIEITIRPYVPEDATRAEELLTRTHRMNLGVLPVAQAIARLDQPNEHHVIVAEMKDIYGDMGRCGIAHLTPTLEGEAMIESLAISCRTRARGLSLAMLAGLLRHPSASFQQYRCRYISNGSNLPLRMLLMTAGFKPKPDSDELVMDAERLAKIELPDWVHIGYRPVP
jgi:FkbH-like protein